MDIWGYVKFLAALIFVLALIGILAYGLRRYGLGAMGLPMGKGNRRLSILETLPLDPRHRLILVRRDDVEYVLIIGQSNVVVERVGAIPDPSGDGLTNRQDRTIQSINHDLPGSID